MILRNENFASFSNDITPRSIQAIITDPPYGLDFLPTYQKLAEVADKLLTDTGVLITQIGSCNSHEMRMRLALHLKIVYEPIVVMTGSQGRVEHTKMLIGHRKFVVLARRGKRHFQNGFVTDTLFSELKDKDFHTWGFPVEPLMYFLERFTKAGDTVFDPCVGGGSTMEACRRAKRNFIGCDIDPLAIKTCQERLEQGVS